MWIEGHINPIWDEEYKNFNFVKKPLPEQQIDFWKSQGYTHKSFTGMMYDSRNSIPDWCSIVSNYIGLYNCGYVFYCMKTGDIMPTHIDHFQQYSKVFGVTKENVYRAIVFLEDWKPGHYFEIEKTGICNYQKGDFVLWSHEVSHAAGNIGIDPRYTLQITGCLESNYKLETNDLI
jgi:hypothetical protein